MDHVGHLRGLETISKENCPRDHSLKVSNGPVSKKSVQWTVLSKRSVRQTIVSKRTEGLTTLGTCHKIIERIRWGARILSFCNDVGARFSRYILPISGIHTSFALQPHFLRMQTKGH